MFIGKVSLCAVNYKVNRLPFVGVVFAELARFRLIGDDVIKLRPSATRGACTINSSLRQNK